MKRPWVVVTAVLTICLVIATAAPLPGDARSFAYSAVGFASLLVAWYAVVRNRSVRRTGWVLVLGGFSAWVVGDLVWAIEYGFLELESYPSWADALYLGGYALLAAGTHVFARRRRTQRDVTPLLDAAIVAAGVTVPALAFVIAPVANDSSMTLLGKLASTAYPVGDILLLAMIVRLLSTTTSARALSFVAMSAALVTTLVADVSWNIRALATGSTETTAWMDVLWLSAYVCVAAAALHPSMSTLTDATPRGADAVSRRHLVFLALGSMLPAVTLFGAGLSGEEIPWLPVALGGAVLTALVLVRMAGLLEQIREQAVQLAALARSDGLTGAPNRRTWDHELSRACARARDTGDPLCVAIIDLDNFKTYNDTHGHQAGDRLLREAVAAWTAILGGAGMLARYGGEEFTVLLPDTDLHQAVARIDLLRAGTPDGQTFSAGVARWVVDTDPARAIADADLALYRAKRSGRNRIESTDGNPIETVPAAMALLNVVVQPIVDAATGAVVAHEALSRFAQTTDVEAAFARAHHDGYGDLLEVAAITRAVARPGRPEGTELFVNVSGAAISSPRFWDALPEDLTGVVFELVEDYVTLDWQPLLPCLGRLVQRGARIAVDDLGAGIGDLTRLLGVRPHIVKVDRSVSVGSATDALRQEVMRALVGIAHAAGAKVCAEGIEEPEDLEMMRAVGVDLVQGYLLGRPQPDWAAEVPTLAAVTAG